MTTLLAFAVLVLAAASVLLFAMLGELNQQVHQLRREAPSDDDDPSIFPVEAGLVPEWPSELGGVTQSGHAFLLVLSTACATCAELAKRIAARETPNNAIGIAVVVSGPDEAACKSFALRYQLDRSSGLLLDPFGEWTRTNLRLQTSPVLVELLNRTTTGVGFALATWPASEWWETNTPTAATRR